MRILKKYILLISLFVAALNADAQNIIKPNSLIANVGYLTNFEDHLVNVGITLRLKIIIKNKINLFTFGGGINYLDNNTRLIDTHLQFALKQGHIFHFIGGTERYATWFIGGHYKFDSSLDRKYLCPEIGYNWYIGSRLHVSTSVLYFLSLNQRIAWNKSIYPGLTGRFLFSNMRLFRKKKPVAKF